MGVTKPDSAFGASPGGGKVLIVDDDPITCQLLALQLEMEDYTCTTLSDPGRVLGVIAEEPPRLILMDYHLGTRDGLDLLRAIRSHDQSGHLPVVVMSALNHRRESEAAGADGFVLKPFDLADLVTTIQEVLTRQGT
jgi:CheY-like chemotaxis protein